MTLRTESLLLRRFRDEDWEDLYEYLSIPEVLQWLPKWECSIEACRQIATDRAKGNTYWAVCLGDRGKMIGHIEFHQVGNPDYSTYEIGCVFHPAYSGNGYATEALGRVIAYGFEELNVHRIIGVCDADHAASQRLMERLGMERDAHFRESHFLRKPGVGEPVDWRDEYSYAILAPDS